MMLKRVFSSIACYLVTKFERSFKDLYISPTELFMLGMMLLNRNIGCSVFNIAECEHVSCSSPTCVLTRVSHDVYIPSDHVNFTCDHISFTCNSGSKKVK